MEIRKMIATSVYTACDVCGEVKNRCEMKEMLVDGPHACYGDCADEWTNPQMNNDGVLVV